MMEKKKISIRDVQRGDVVRFGEGGPFMDALVTRHVIEGGTGKVTYFRPWMKRDEQSPGYPCIGVEIFEEHYSHPDTLKTVVLLDRSV
jgi:hypothetical protein